MWIYFRKIKSTTTNFPLLINLSKFCGAIQIARFHVFRSRMRGQFAHEMLEFVVDKIGIEGKSWEDVAEKQQQSQEHDSEEEFSKFIPLEKLCNLETEARQKKNKNSSNYDFSLDNTYLITSYTKEGTIKSDKSYVNKLLEKSTLTPGLEKEKVVPVRKNKRTLQRERKAQREKTKGKDWFDLPATKVTEEVKNDLEILKMRSVLDSKQFYKKNDVKVIPKYFQIGKVVEGAADFYNGRIPKSQRKKTLVDELLADAKFRALQKKKYKEIVDDSRRNKHNKKRIAVRRNPKKSHKDDWLKWD